jgi:galactokinase
VLTSLAGKQWNLCSIDHRFNSLDHVPFVGTALIICDSGVRGAEANVATAEIRDHCLAAARKLQARSLRSVEPKALRAAQSQLDEREFGCATHVTGEILRVAAAERSLREEDHRQLGNYVTLSHESLREYLQASCPELDLLVNLARAHDGCYGARSIGRGFGGSTLNLVAYHAAEPFMAQMAAGYEARTGRKMKPLVCQVVDGAG